MDKHVCISEITDKIPGIIDEIKKLLRRGPVVLSPPATEETGAMGREIESRQDYLR
jgi:hypothetical protein